MSLRSINRVSLAVAAFGLFGGAIAAGGPAEGAAGTRVVRVSASAKARAAVAGLQTQRRMDYGAFEWVELSSVEFAKLQASGVPFEEQVEPFTLTLGELKFDPAQSRPVVGGWDQPLGAGEDLRLVQFHGPTRPEWLSELETRGLRVVQYIHPHTYVVWANQRQLQGLTAVPDAPEPRAVGEAEPAPMSEVRWTGEFLPAYRVLPRWRSLAAEAVDTHVMIYRGANAASVMQQLQGLGAKLDSVSDTDPAFRIVQVRMSGDQFRKAAGIPGVYSIQPVPTDGGDRGEMSNQVNVNNVNASNQAFPGYLAWISSAGVNGNGVIIANVDSGIQDTHPNLVNRMRPCTGSSCGGATSSSHGTHTAGIMAADGTSGVLDGFGFQRGLGVAPGAGIVEQLYSPTYTQAGGMLLLMTHSYNNGASLSGNSWGPSGTPRGYDANTRQVDVGVRDADPNASGNQPLSFVLSFMNGNGGTSTQGTPDEGKNLLSVGSTKMQTSGGAQILAINDLSSNSGHGPALDGRKIPLMVAPGCQVDSTVPTNSYGLLCGTSMASPHVSGGVALFIERYRSLPDYSADPSPALVKAAFLAVCRNLAGFLDANGGTLGNPFDSKQGWGRFDLQAIVTPSTSVRYFDDPQLFTATGQEWSRTVSAQDPSKPLRIMLVWTDAPGHGLGGSTPAWNNNLDLVVESGANTYRGNVFAGAGGWSVTGGTADDRNNTEAVFIGPTAPSAYTIRVIAANINSDGVPGNGSPTDQDFALACYNCAEEPGFTVAVTPASTEVCAPADANYTVQVNQILGFTDPVTLSISGNPAGTTAAFSPNPVTPPGSATLTISNTSGASDGEYGMVVTGTSGAVVRNVAANLKMFTGSPATPSLSAPADGATGVSLQPNLTWSPAAQAQTYDVEIALDSGFGSIVSNGSGLIAANFTPASALSSGTLHYWRVRAANACGQSGWSVPRSFTTRVTPAILLVDDDDNGPDVRSYYTSALMAIGRDYDLWDTNNTDNEPSAAYLSAYSTVIWFTGDEFGGTAGPGAAGSTALASYLDSGKCLFMSSQDYLYDRGLTAFASGYLGVGSYTNDTRQTSVTGSAPLFGGMGPYTLSYPFTNWSDSLVGGAGAGVAFAGNLATAAIYKDTGVYRSQFWAFPMEAIPDAATRAALMNMIVNWCAELQCQTARGDMTATGGVNGDDIQQFAGCIIGGSVTAPGCRCADMDANNALNANDVTLFVNCVLGGPCP